MEIVAGPYGPDKKERAIVASTDPKTLPDLSPWYQVTNLPTPAGHVEGDLLFSPGKGSIYYRADEKRYVVSFFVEGDS